MTYFSLGCQKKSLCASHIHTHLTHVLHRELSIKQWECHKNNLTVWVALNFSWVFPRISGDTDIGDSQSGPYISLPRICLVCFSLVSTVCFWSLWFTVLAVILPVFCTSFFFSLFLPCLLLLPLPNHHPTCPQLHFPLFLPVPFCRHDSFSLYLFSFIFSCPPTSLNPVCLPFLSLLEEDLVKGLLEVLISDLENPWMLRVSVFFLIFLHHSTFSSLSITQSLLSSVSQW